MRTFINNKRIPVTVALAIWLIAASGLHASDCYVLSAGVDDYAKASKLKGCLNDARNTSAAFKAQKGKLFGAVQTQTLLDGQATRDNISQRFQDIGRRAKAGDFVVLFLSGHGGRSNNNLTWYFLPFDYDPQNRADTSLTDRDILDAADQMARDGKKVMVIIDACFAGQLAITAREYLARHQTPNGGGIVLMLSSSSEQLSIALGQYSAFAKAFADGMNGGADLNRDGKTTLQEMKKYTYDQTYQLLRQRNNPAKQDSEFAWSPSMSAGTVLAAKSNIAGNPGSLPPIATPAANQPPVQSRPNRSQPTQWTGTENLAGFGALSFQMLPGGRAVMTDTQGATEGTWQQQSKQITFRFNGGRVVYSGVLNGTTLAGTAHNDRTRWSWSVQAQSPAQAMAGSNR